MCVQWQGRVFIDDVWGGGTAEESRAKGYPLLSTAIAGGLYHPNCKDRHTTYFEGIFTAPKLLTQTDIAMAELNYRLEQDKKYAERQAKKYARLAKYSLDEDNQLKYSSRVQKWQVKADCSDMDYMSNSFRPKFSSAKDLNVENLTINIKRVENSMFDLYTDIDASDRNKAVRLAEKNMRAIQKELPDGFKMPPIAVVNFEKAGLNANAIGGYHKESGVLYINSKYDTTDKILDYVNKFEGQFANKTQYAPYLHELGHKYYYNRIESLAKNKNIEYNRAKEFIDGKIYDYIHDNQLGDTLKSELSIYAQKGYAIHSYTEIIAESFSVMKNNMLASNLINLLKR